RDLIVTGVQTCALPISESLRAQANVLRELGRPDEAKKLVDIALRLSPDHPALLKASAEAAQRDGDRALAARLLIRSAGATRDPRSEERRVGKGRRARMR